MYVEQIGQNTVCPYSVLITNTTLNSMRKNVYVLLLFYVEQVEQIKRIKSILNSK